MQFCFVQVGKLQLILNIIIIKFLTALACLLQDSGHPGASEPVAGQEMSEERQ